MTTQLPAKFARLAETLNTELVERSEEIPCALEALVAGTTFFMVGEPGVAKSLLARRLAAYIRGGEFFDHDMDKFSTPEDLFGPRSLAAMKEDRWERAIDGTLVTADWAMLDEVFEAPSALLKTLLRALNERTFHQGTEIIDMRLTTVLCASNSIPAEPRLQPLYDRLIIRRQIKRISGPAAFVTMLATSRDEKPEPLLEWTDVLVAQVQASRVTIPEGLLATIAEIRQGLASVRVFPSDRRFYEALKVIRAAAWLDECSMVEPEHLRRLENILWHDPDQIPEVTRVIDTVLEPIVYRADELLREVRAMATNINGDLEETRRKQLGNELTDKLNLARVELDELEAKAASKRHIRKIKAARVALREVSALVLTELYGVPASEVSRP